MEDGGLDGSSPHTRGAHSRSDPLGGTRGIIPAYAGSTGLGRVPRADGRDHPRIRGEHSYVPERFGAGVGSSPHTRGAHPFDQGADDVLRIIPAYAGSTSRLSALNVKSPDHPRIRGEHPMRNTDPHGRAGSSPHTRGARVQVRILRVARGIIPAYAGSTFQGVDGVGGHGDHPRIRGEHSGEGFDRRGLLGSSPHTRGARVAGVGRCLLIGIIPAYAGSTWNPQATLRWRPDHPRIRGEHTIASLGEEKRLGSSPHTRGARSPGLTSLRSGRIIPAYAGSTFMPTPSAEKPWDHPRIRGEHGSGRGLALELRGIIPAYAGSTSVGLPIR